MTMPSTTVKQLVQTITSQLKKKGIPTKKLWWENYLKNVIKFYGVPMADIRKVVASACKVDNDSSTSPSQQQKQQQQQQQQQQHQQMLRDLSWSLIREPVEEQKMAGVLVLQNHITEYEMTDLDEIETLFDGDDIHEWHTTDWLCIRVLEKIILQHGDDTTPIFKRWASSDGLWKKRSALVSYVNLTKEETHLDPIFSIANTLVNDDRRFCQTAIGWVLRNVSQTNADRVVEFVQTNQQQMSKEAINMSTVKLSAENRRLLGLDTKRRKKR